MAIGTDALVEFYGTQDSLDDGTTSAVTDTSFSVSADHSTWTNDDDAPYASVVLVMQYPSGTISAGAQVVLHMRMTDVKSTTDEAEPDASTSRRPVGVFKLDEGLAATTDVAIAEDIILPNTKTSQAYDFRIENLTGVTMTAGWTLDITPKTFGPHA